MPRYLIGKVPTRHPKISAKCLLILVTDVDGDNLTFVVVNPHPRHHLKAC
jgi:hypothetical protein